MPPQFAFLVLSVTLLISRIAALCPAQCHCNHTSLTVSCERGGLEHFPIQLNPRVERLSLAGNQIVRLRGSFDYYTGLVSLNLSSNAVVELAALTFEHQRRLEELDLGDNLLTALPRRTLAGLRRLVRLSLAGNQLTRLEDGAFFEASSLRRLDLSRNRLEALGGALRGLPQLASLNLCGNRLASISATELRPLAAVRELYLCNNGAEALRGVEQLASVRELDLSGNRLSSLRGLAGLVELRRLDLSRNRLKTLMGVVPAGLRALDISSNLLSRLGGDDLAGLRQLEELRLCDGPELVGLRADTLTECPALHTLHLCNNSQLSSLPAGFMTASLRRVDLRDNQLVSAPEPAAAANLTWLDLRGNQLHCNCSLRWLHTAVVADSVPDVLCAGPEALRGRALSQLRTGELWCAPRLAPLALALGVPLLVLVLVAGAFCALCRRRRRHKTATAGGCVAALAHSRGRKVAAPDDDRRGDGDRVVRWPRYWPYEEACARRSREEAVTKLYSGHSETSPDLYCPSDRETDLFGPDLKLVLSADSRRDRAGYSSDDLYATSFNSVERPAALSRSSDRVFTLGSAGDGRRVPSSVPRRFSAAYGVPAELPGMHSIPGRSVHRWDYSRPASVTASDLTRSREGRRRKLSGADVWRPNREASDRRDCPRRNGVPRNDSQFTDQTSDGVQYIPVTVV